MRGLRRCFGHRTSIVTALVDNPVGRLVEDLMLGGGVDQSHVQWLPFDGIGREARWVVRRICGVCVPRCRTSR